MTGFVYIIVDDVDSNDKMNMSMLKRLWKKSREGKFEKTVTRLANVERDLEKAQLELSNAVEHRDAGISTMMSDIQV